MMKILLLMFLLGCGSATTHFDTDRCRVLGDHAFLRGNVIDVSLKECR